jgi:hypothetical protein
MMPDCNKEDKSTNEGAIKEKSPLIKTPTPKKRKIVCCTGLQLLTLKESTSEYKKRMKMAWAVTPGSFCLSTDNINVAEKENTPAESDLTRDNDGSMTNEEATDNNNNAHPSELAKEVNPVDFSNNKFQVKDFKIKEFFGNVDDDVKGTIKDDIPEEDEVDVLMPEVYNVGITTSRLLKEYLCNEDASSESNDEYAPNTELDQFLSNDDNSFLDHLGEYNTDSLILEDEFLPQYSL